MSHKRLLIFSFGVSIILFLLAPNYYLWGYNFICSLLFLFIVIIYYLYCKKNNFFDFDTIFIFSFFINNFVYPVFLYPINPQFFIMFSFNFNEDVITRATSLSLLGFSVYILGRLKTYKNVVSPGKYKKKRIKHYPFFYLSVIAFCLLIATGSLSYLRSIYEGENGSITAFSKYIGVIYSPLIILTLVTDFFRQSKRNKLVKLNNLDKPMIVFIAIQAIAMLSTGRRGGVLSVFLVVIWLYSFYIKHITKSQFFSLATIGAALLSIIGILRVGGSTDNFRLADLFMDLIINNRNTFVAIDYVDREGITYGESMLACIFKIIPFISSPLHRIFNLNVTETSSSLLLTKETLGDDFSLGLGTSIIADLYLGFGSLGVIIFMYLLGVFIKYLESNIRNNNNIYFIIIYAVMMSQSVFIVRSEYFFSASQIVLCVFLYWLISKFKIGHNENNNSVQ